MDNLLKLFPSEERAYWRETAEKAERIMEIRFRVRKPICVYDESGEYMLDRVGQATTKVGLARCIEERFLEEFLAYNCKYSAYAYEEEIRQGFLTMEGGHRIGVSGHAVPGEDGSIRTIRNIQFVNIRIAHEIIGVADNVLPGMYRGSRIQNTLIISPPGCGKTTILRDLVRQISDGNQYCKGKKVGLVDERSEIAGCYQGVPQKRIGMRTDVLENCPKITGMMFLLRSMSPEVIAVDELGKNEEFEALRFASACGCGILATAHGENIQDVSWRFGIDQKLMKQIFQRCVILGKEEGKCFIREIIEQG